MKLSELKGRIVEDLYDWVKTALKELVAKKMQNNQPDEGVDDEEETSSDNNEE